MDVPDNLKNRLNIFKTKVSSLKIDCQNLLSKYDSIRETIRGNALEEATLDLTTAFTINSLFWLYLTCKGLDPKNHDLRLEINRIKQANLRLKKLQEASKAPKLDIPAAKRFIRSALFDPENDKSVKDEKTDDVHQDDDQRCKRKRLNEEDEEDTEMKPKVEDDQEEDRGESKDDEEKEKDEEDEEDEEEKEKATMKITSNNQDGHSRNRGSRKRPNEKSDKGSVKRRMFKKQMKNKAQRRPNREIK